MNCAAFLEESEAKFFGGAFVCPTCHQLGMRFQERATQILKRLLLVNFETIRIAMVRGMFHFGNNKVDEMSEQDILGFVHGLTEKLNASGGITGVVHTASEPGSVVGGRQEVLTSNREGGERTQA
jgi:hypothetical protein